MRHIAPGGTPISLNDITKWIYNTVAADDILGDFKQEICSNFGVKHCFFLSTGRAAMCVLLQSLSQLNEKEKNEVVIPSYTCYSVPSSVAKAGLKIRICDIDPDTLDYDLQKLSEIDFTNVLCIVATNLYGIPNDLKQINQIAKDNNVFLVDDAAQCMGGTVDGKYSGTAGDAGLFSLDKGKNITSIDGGILITDSDDLASCIKSNMTDMPNLTAVRKISYIAKLFFYAAFLHPNLYWIPDSLPFLKLGTTVYTTEYPVGSYNGLLGAMGIQLFRKVNEITAARIENAVYLNEHLKGLPFIEVPRYKDYVRPVYLRFPVLVQEVLRDEIVEKLNGNGIGATASYPASIADIKEIQDIIINKSSGFEGGRQVAGNIVTLPTHPYVSEGDLASIVSLIKETVNGHL
jgi:dTDP-4-amino-4,6-dideoxygalactose transaminase